MMNWLIALLVAVTLPQTPANPSPPRVAPPVTDQTESYKVGPDDELKIEVFREQDLSGSFRIDSDGRITYPFLNRVLVAGLTVQEISQLLQKQLASGWVNDPQVSVAVETFRSRHIFILGEVKVPGKYPLQGEVTLLEIMALAGSLNVEASDQIVVIRPKGAASESGLTPDDPAANILTRVFLSDLKSGKPVGNVLLENGDTIYVPSAERVYVSGHVKNPGSFVWKRGLTVEQAITLAGGVTERGTMRRLAIRRRVGDEVKEFGVKREDFVQPNDTIIVKMRFI